MLNTELIHLIIRVVTENMEYTYLSISVSYILLLAVLHFYNFEKMYRTIVGAVSILGLWFPVLYFIPYFLLLWRVFIGLNVTTEHKLYIGKLGKEDDSESADPSNASAHWIVAIRQDQDYYLYTHAVGQVVSGQGIKKPFKRISAPEISAKYQLTYVGFVTRKNTEQKMRELVEDEPMRSGNTCQEFAVDIAFQLSASRSFTFMKTMTMIRIRTLVFYTLFITSAVLQITGFHWLAEVFNFVVISNVFVAVEMSRIGLHNSRTQNSIWPVIKAYLYYPKKVNFLQLILCGLVLFAIYYRTGLLEAALVGFVITIVITMRG